MAMEPKQFMDLRKKKKKGYVDNTDQIAKNPNKVASVEDVTTPEEREQYDTEATTEAMEALNASKPMQRQVASSTAPRQLKAPAQVSPEKEQAKQESIQLMDQQTTPEQKVEMIAQVENKPVEQVVEEQKKTGGLSDKFKMALSALAPQAIGMLVGGAIGGKEGAVEGFQTGTAVGKGLFDVEKANRALEIQEKGQEANMKAKQQQLFLDAQKEQRLANKKSLDLNLKAVGRGDAPVAVTEDGNFFVGDEKIDAANIRNTKFMVDLDKAKAANLKAAQDMSKEYKDSIKWTSDKFSKAAKDIQLGETASNFAAFKSIVQNPDSVLDEKIKLGNKTFDGSADTTSARDAALIITYMKLLDPGSVVREGEFQMASKLGPKTEAVQAFYNQMTGQGKLSDTARNDLIDAVNRLGKGRLESAKTQLEGLRGTGKALGLNDKDLDILMPASLRSLEQNIGKNMQEQAINARIKASESAKSKLGF